MGRSAGMDSTTRTALALVQQTSASALTAADELTYATTAASGCRALASASSRGVTMSAIGHPAFGSGSRTVRSGQRRAAVSAMKWTPQTTITWASFFAASRAIARLSPTKSAMSWTSGTW